MPVYTSSSLIDQLYDQTDRFMIQAAQWQILPASQFEVTPSAQSWSASQCLAHLNSYGEYYLPQLHYAIVRGKERGKISVPEFKTGLLGNYFTNLMLPENNGVPSRKMKSPKDHLPIANDDSAIVLATFIEQQEKMIALLQQARHVNLNAVKVPISIAKFIRLRLGDVFMFIVAHNSRHMLQAERALGSSS